MFEELFQPKYIDADLSGCVCHFRARGPFRLLQLLLVTAFCLRGLFFQRYTRWSARLGVNRKTPSCTACVRDRLGLLLPGCILCSPVPWAGAVITKFALVDHILELPGLDFVGWDILFPGIGLWDYLLAFALCFSPAITPSTRRRLRRQRATARLELHFHRKKVISIPKARLLRHISVLKAHHSKDPLHLSALAKIVDKMANKQSWRCRPCWRINKESHLWCPACGKWWKAVMDTTFAPQNTPRQNPSSYSAWDSSTWDDGPWQQHPRRPSGSPRRQQFYPLSPRSKGKGKKESGKGKKEGKDKSQGQGKGPSKSEPPPTWATSQASKPSTESDPNAATLQALITALSKNDAGLTPEVKAIIADQSKQSAQMLPQPGKTCTLFGTSIWQTAFKGGSSILKNLPTKTSRLVNSLLQHRNSWRQPKQDWWTRRRMRKSWKFPTRRRRPPRDQNQRPWFNKAWRQWSGRSRSSRRRQTHSWKSRLPKEIAQKNMGNLRLAG